MLGLSGTSSQLYLCICVFVFVYLCMRHLVISVLISLDQELSENIWFVWSKTSYCGENVGCHACGRRTDNGRRNVKIELEFWKQNSQNSKSTSETLQKSDTGQHLECLQLHFYMKYNLSQPTVPDNRRARLPS